MLWPYFGEGILFSSVFDVTNFRMQILKRRKKLKLCGLPKDVVEAITE